MKILFVLFFIATSVFATSNQKVQIQWRPPQILINTGDGYHINQEAPVKLNFQNQENPLRPHSLTAKNLIFDLGNAKDTIFKISFYICDDQNTSCELYRSTYRQEQDKILEINDLEHLQKEDRSIKPLQLNAHHFITDNLEAALKTAELEHKLLLVDFQAPWCPACVRLETEVFPQKAFQNLARKLIKVSLNADLEANKEAFRKYDVNLLPTLILMNSKGEEISRMIDYKPLAVFNRELKKALNLTKLTTEDLTHKANQKDKEAIKTLALRSFNMNHFEESQKWYELLGEESIISRFVKIAALNERLEKDKTAEGVLRDELEKAITLYPRSYEALDWRLSLFEIDKDNANEKLKENIIQLNKTINNKKHSLGMFKNTTAGTIAFPRLEAYLYLYKTYEKLDNISAKEKSLKQLQNEIKKIKVSAKKPGELLQIIQYQREAQMPEEENSLKILTQAYPQSHVYHMKLGNFYFRNKKYQEALPELNLSTQLENPVSLSNLALLAKLQKELKLTEELKKTIERADNLILDKSERSQEKLKKLHELLLPEK